MQVRQQNNKFIRVGALSSKKLSRYELHFMQTLKNKIEVLEA